MIAAILIPLILIILFIFIHLQIKISTHHEMVSSFCTKFYKVPYEIFEKEFNKVDWRILEGYKSLEGYNYFSTKFHTSIIEINNIGYWITGMGYLKALKLRDKKLKELGYNPRVNPKEIKYPQN